MSRNGRPPSAIFQVFLGLPVPFSFAEFPTPVQEGAVIGGAMKRSYISYPEEGG